MATISPERHYSAPPEEVFEAALRSAQALGYTVFEVDEHARTFSFCVGEASAFREDPLTVAVVGEGSASRVAVSGGAVRMALASRGRLMWNGQGPVSTRLLDALSRDLLAPRPGWLDDPSGRFAQRWWDGSAWTSGTRDSEFGVGYEDPPGALPPPWISHARPPGSTQPPHSHVTASRDRSSAFAPLSWRAGTTTR